MKKFLKKLIYVSFIVICFFQIKQVQSLVPYYYLPTKKNLEREAFSIGKNAYQLLYFGQYEKSLNMAKLAVKINKNDEKLWLILSEAQVANKLYKNALISLNKAQEINPENSDTYILQGNIYLKTSKLQKAKTALETALRIESNNHKAIFQLGNILLMEKNYSGAIKLFEQSVEIKPDFWQAINNKGLAYFEKNNINSSINLFKKAISIEENAEPLLGLASCLRMRDLKSALQLTKKALNKDPKYVSYDYRKEQLLGDKLQASTEILLKNNQLQADVILAKAKIKESFED